MEIYENENDQVEAVKRFFAENGKALAVGVILGVGALIGWRYWNSHQVDSARSASLAYQNAVTAVSEGKPDSIPAAEKFAAENKNTYGALASLELAQQFVDKNELEKAAAQLQQGLADTSDENLKAVIGEWLAQAFELPLVTSVGYETPGSFGSWCADLNLHCITAEFPPISSDEASEKYLFAMANLLRWHPKDAIRPS